LQLNDSLLKLRKSLLPNLSNFFSTADRIPPLDSMDSAFDSFRLESILPSRTHPLPLLYLPAKLTPEQDAFLSKRKALVKDLAEKEWESFKEERTAGIDEIASLRRKVAEEDERKKSDKERQNAEQDKENGSNGKVEGHSQQPESDTRDVSSTRDVDMDDGTPKPEAGPESDKKDVRPEDDDDAVEY